jgi:hypothetical protein
LHVHGIGGDGGQVDHTTLANIGTYTHAQIDTHILDTANPHGTTFTQVGAPPATLILTAGAGLVGGGDLSANRTFNVVANADGSIVVNANDIQVGVLATDAQHGNRGGATLHALVIASGADGFMSGVDKAKLDGLPTSAVPTSRTINGFALTADITLAAVDVGADASGTAAIVQGNLAVHAGLTTTAHGGIVPSARTITAGNGLTGGGDLSANRALAVAALNTTITVAAGGVSVGTITDTNVAAANKDGVAGTASMRTLGTGAQQACGGADARLSDARLPLAYQQVNDATRTTLTGAGSTSYPPVGGATKLTMTTAALPAGTYKITWSATIDYSVTNRDLSIRIQNTTDTVTYQEVVFRPTNAGERHNFSGHAIVTFAGVAKTFTMQFHTANTGDTAGVANAYLDIQRVL